MPDTKLGRADLYDASASATAASPGKARKDAMIGADNNLSALPCKIVEAATLGTGNGACIFCRYRQANRARLFDG